MTTESTMPEPDYIPGAKLLELATDGSIEINRSYWINLVQDDGTLKRKAIQMRYSQAEADALLPSSAEAKRQVLRRARILAGRHPLLGEIDADSINSIKFGGAKIVAARVTS